MQAGPSRKKERQARPARKTKRRENNQKLESTIAPAFGKETDVTRSLLPLRRNAERGGLISCSPLPLIHKVLDAAMDEVRYV
jgi:hypothetical protein